VFRAIDHHFVVECDDDALAELIDDVFAHCFIDLVDREPDEVFRLEVDTTDVHLTSNEGTRTIPRSRALQTVVSLVNLRGAQLRAPTLPVVHGGAVAFGGEAVLLPGRSGSGKSTLVAALASSGAEYLADELVAVRSPTCVSGYPKSITLKPGSWSALPFERPIRTGPAATFVDQVGYASPEHVGALAVLEEAWPAVVVFPTWDAGRDDPQVERLDAADALLLLAEAAYLPLTAVAFFELADLVARVPAYSVRYGSTAHAVASVEQVRSQGPSPRKMNRYGPSRQPSEIAVADFGDLAVLFHPDGSLASIRGFDLDLWKEAEDDPDHPFHTKAT